MGNLVDNGNDFGFYSEGVVKPFAEIKMTREGT